MFIHDRLLENNPPWNSFNYVYFSEGDHVLHMRSATDIYNVMDSTRDAPIALSPHRLQTIPLPKAFPEVQSAWTKSDIDRLSSIVLITENDTLSRGSCCDDGRFIFNNCKNWWYNCQEWGLTNYTKWVRFGESGYPMPFGSEHQAKCSYSPTKVLCPVPKTCKSRFPYRKEDATTFWYEACDEIPKREMTYNHTLALEKEREASVKTKSNQSRSRINLTSSPPSNKDKTSPSTKREVKRAKNHIAIDDDAVAKEIQAMVVKKKAEKNKRSSVASRSSLAKVVTSFGGDVSEKKDKPGLKQRDISIDSVKSKSETIGRGKKKAEEKTKSRMNKNKMDDVGEREAVNDDESEELKPTDDDKRRVRRTSKRGRRSRKKKRKKGAP